MSQWRRGIVIVLAAVIAVAFGYVTIDRIWLSRPDEQRVSEAVTPALPAGSSLAISIPDRSIAVLPFTDMSEKKDQEYFADGMAEQLIDVLVKVPGLYVPARTSTFYFKGKQTTLAGIAKALRVAHVLEGSVRKAGNTLRVTVQLIRVDTGNLLWSETYDRQLEDVFAVQDDIAAAVVERLKVTLLESVPKAERSAPEAYALMLQARQAHRLGTKEGWDRAIPLYQQALRIDPAYGAASDGLASIYLNQGSLGMRAEAESARLARDVINRALAIHPDDAMALSKLGSIANSVDNDLASATRHVQHALAIEPDNPVILGDAAKILQSLGQLDKGIALMEYLVERDPLNPIGHWNLGNHYRVAGRHDDAIASVRTAINLAPRAIGMHGSLGLALLLNGEKAAALEELRLETSEPVQLVGMGVTYHALGQNAESDARLAELIAKYGHGGAFDVASVLAYRGEADRTFEWLEKAIEYHDEGISTVYPAQQWAFSNIQKDPRWLPFLRKIGRAPEQLAAIKFEVKLPAHD
jgi:TolB-like protein/Flp pilus assembly protein TadD